MKRFYKIWQVAAILNFILLNNGFSQFEWTQIPSPTSNNLYSVSFADSLVGTAVGANGTIIRTTDGGLHWTLQPSGMLGSLYAIKQLNRNTAISVGDSTILITTDSGLNWVVVFGGQNLVFKNLAMIDTDTGVVVSNVGVYRTTNGGQTWKDPIIPSNTGPLAGIAFEDRDSGIVMATITPIKTTDAGRTWRALAAISDFYASSIASPHPNKYIAVGRIHHTGFIAETVDGGFSWNYTNAGYQKYYRDISFFDTSNGITVGDNGFVEYTTDGGSVWIESKTDTLSLLFGIRMTSSRVGISVGRAGTILRLTLSGNLNVDDHDDNGKLFKYDLYQNYPNPFNPETKIEYSLPEKVHVTIKLFDAIGREIRTLVNEIQEAGYKELMFNAGNLSNGIYLYQLQAGSFMDVKKMLIIK
jgi:photosystem II stability/assembly factor-like uncharacterized protein